MKDDFFGVIYTGESNMQLRDLTYSRAIAAMPFGGRYRCIDFTLSNMVNSGISNVGIIAQKNYHSLMDHLGSGKEWDLRRKRDGLFLLPPFVTKDNTGIYKGSVDALRSCLGYIRRSSQRYVVYSGSHTLYNTTYNGMLEQHIATGADITMMYSLDSSEPSDDHYNDRRLILDPSGRITDMELDPYRPQSHARSCDVFLLEKTLLEYLVEEASARANYNWSKDIILQNLNHLRIYGYRYDGYVARLSSTRAYFRHNMALLDARVRQDLFNTEHPIYTKIKDEAPAFYSPDARVSNTIVADGCHIEGTVENSVLFRGAHVGPGAVVRNCILMQASDVQEQCELEYAILDKSVTVKRGRRLMGSDAFPLVLRKGTTV